jgi:ribosomal protein S14
MAVCEMCGQPVPWVTTKAAKSILGVSDIRVRQFIDQGRLPGTEKHGHGYRIPIASVIALKETRDA